MTRKMRSRGRAWIIKFPAAAAYSHIFSDPERAHRYNERMFRNRGDVIEVKVIQVIAEKKS